MPFNILWFILMSKRLHKIFSDFVSIKIQFHFRVKISKSLWRFHCYQKMNCTIYGNWFMAHDICMWYICIRIRIRIRILCIVYCVLYIERRTIIIYTFAIWKYHANLFRGQQYWIDYLFATMILWIQICRVYASFYDKGKWRNGARERE